MNFFFNLCMSLFIFGYEDSKNCGYSNYEYLQLKKKNKIRDQSLRKHSQKFGKFFRNPIGEINCRAPQSPPLICYRTQCFSGRLSFWVLCCKTQTFMTMSACLVRVPLLAASCPTITPPHGSNAPFTP